MNDVLDCFRSRGHRLCWTCFEPGSCVTLSRPKALWKAFSVAACRCLLRWMPCGSDRRSSHDVCGRHYRGPLLLRWCALKTKVSPVGWVRKKQIDASPSLAVVVRAAFVLAAVLLRNNFLSLSNGMTEARSQPNGDVIPIAVGAGVDVFEGGTGHSLKHVWTPAAPLTFKLMDCTTLKPETNHTCQTDDASFPYWRCDILTALAAGFVGR